MKVSVITVCFNSEEYIEECIQSVHLQKYNNIEHIIIDGGSTDSTLRKIRNRLRPTDLLISEPDNGIYDAMNKGLSYASGEIVGFLNSDDVFAEGNCIQEFVSKFDNDKLDCVYGDIAYVKRDDIKKIIRVWANSSHSIQDLKLGWIPPHPTFYLRRKLALETGGFSQKLKLAADFEFMFKLLKQKNIKSGYIDKVCVFMRVGGVTNNSILNILRQNIEILSVIKQHYSLLNTTLFFMFKLQKRLSQFK
ncbi:glycosyltransferase [Amylibacter sp.]|nr:glycosyltransferase [Amylibacter sp.]